jgi:TonB family protein
MQDRVAEVLAQRSALNRSAGTGVALSLLLHSGLGALALYAATHASPPRPASPLRIQFASMRQPSVPSTAARTAPRIEEPTPQAEPQKQPKIEEPKAQTPPPKQAEKNTVPLSPFGRSTKKGSETPPAAAPKPAASSAPLPGATTADIPIGGSGVTGLEGGDFPYTLYIEGMQRRIGSNWFRPQIAGGMTVVIYFRIKRDGSITDASVETSSGNGTFDRAALSAVRSSSPLPPLPFGYTENYLGVHLTFR